MRARSFPPWQRNLFLALAGLGSSAIFWPARLAVREGQISAFLWLAAAQALLCLLGAALIWNAKPGRTALLIVLGLGGLLRLGMLFETPKISDDIYRYIWDGRVQAAGINPYLHIPADPKLASLRDAEIYPYINRRDYAPTIYPPMAQMIFFAIHQVSESITGFKACLLVFEAITIWSLIQLLTSFGLPRERVLMYAWNPLVLWEFSGSGHIDAAMISFIALALVARRARRDTLTGFLLGLAVLTKFFPLALFPAFYRRWDWKMPLAAAVTIGLGYLPYLGAGRHVFGFLSSYADEEGITSGRYFLLLIARYIFGGTPISVGYYFVFVLVVLGVLAHRAVFRWNETREGFVFSAGILAFTFTLLLSPHYAWYWSWTAPFLAFLPWRTLLPFFLMTTASLIHYGTWFEDGRCFGFEIHPHFALSLLQLVPVSLFLTSLFILRRKHPELFRTGWNDVKS